MVTHHMNQYYYIPYQYKVTSNTMASSGTNTQSLIMDNDHDFELHYVIGYSSQDTNTFFNNNFQLLITDKTSSFIWANLPIDQIAIGPTNFFLPERRPVVLPARDTLTFAFTNLFAGNLIANVVFKGYKLKPC